MPDNNRVSADSQGRVDSRALDPSSWSAIPARTERWCVANATGALVVAIVSVVSGRAEPSVAFAALSMGWVYRYAPAAPRGVGLANLVTAARLFAMALAVVLAPEDGLLVGSVAALVYVFDGVDGWVARARGEVSGFGAQFDMETDSHLVMLICVHLVTRASFGPWVLAIGAMRYGFVLARWLRSSQPAQIVREPTRERRSNLGRIIYSFVVLALAFACVADVRSFAEPVLATALAALTWSFGPDYLALMRR